MTHKSIIIAIDGPAASGKGTLSLLLAKALGYDRLDTGMLYRAVAWIAMERHETTEEGLEKIAVALTKAHMEHEELRSDAVAVKASSIAKLPKLRKALLTFQKEFAHHPPGGRGAILDGRDIGSVVCPDAPIKFYVEASAAERATRRYKEMQQRGGTLSYEEIKASIEKRDFEDKNRTEAPLTQAPDAIVLKTDGKTPQDVCAEALEHIAKRLKAIHEETAHHR